MIKCGLGLNLRLRSYSKLKGEKTFLAKGENSNILYKYQPVESPVVSSSAVFKGIKIQNVFEYDINTKAGSSCTFTLAE